MRYVLLFAALALGIMAGWAFEAQAGGTCTNSFCTDYKASCTDYDLPESSGCLGHLRENGCVIWDCYRCEDDNPAIEPGKSNVHSENLIGKSVA